MARGPFAQVEAHFTTKRLHAQNSRFDYVVASLSPEIATEVRDLILKPPEANPYDTLKEQLIRSSSSEEPPLPSNVGSNSNSIVRTWDIGSQPNSSEECSNCLGTEQASTEPS